MAGNLQADNSGNILCEFDYNNIIVVDPNRTIDAFGNIQERLVDHENLVMFANLEAELLPRTKLAVGVAPNDRIRTISVAKMNFLKPTKNSYLGTGYYDEITGENTTQFKGENQMMTSVSVPKDGSKPYVTDAPADLNNIMDNGLLGITQINIQTNTSFIPSVSIELEDVQGRALFQLGNNSPYAAFFNLPYPPFYLTLKGYYGQAIRYQLNLEKFNARFNSFSGNYQVSLQFKGYKFNILNEVAMGHLLALPHMYSQTFDVATSPVGAQTTSKTAESQSKTQNASTANSSISNTNVVSQITTERGYQKIFEVYSEYKAKGLIPADLPELTLLQLMNKLETFEKNIENSFPKVEVEPLTNIRSYRETLKNYFESVRGSGSWFSTYIDPKPIIKKDGQRIYTFKKLDLEVRDDAVNKLKSIIENYNNTLSQNNTLGKGKPDEIKNPIAYKNIVVSPTAFTDINWEETAKNQLGLPSVTKIQIDNVTSDYSNLIKPYFTTDKNGNIVEGERPVFFIFEGEGRFDKQITSLEAQANKKLSFYESEISAKLLRKIEDRATGIGFKPTVRNIIAVIMASAEGFIRMLDDVHTNAWNVKYDPIRKSAILDNNSSAPNTEDQDHLVIAPLGDSQLKNAEIPVYPWPQFFVESPEDKKGRFQLKYIGDPSVVDLTKGYLYDKWPEVEFVEEYMKGITKKFDAPQAPEPLANERDTNTITINAIEFPSLGLAYANKEEIKFFYEIWERQFLTSHYSGLIRANPNQVQDLFKLNVQTEVNNIYDAINVSAPYLSLKLKNYNINASNYDSFLEGISNNGTGRAYQDFIRDFFVTPYIKTMTENPTALLSVLDIGKIPQSNADSLALENLIKNATNNKFVVDTIPFTNPTWVTSNMSDGIKSNGNDVYNTTKTLKIFEQRKVISNFTDIFDVSTNRPVTNFAYINYDNPTLLISDYNTNQLPLSTFYTTRTTKDFTTTEGYVYGNSPTSNFLYETTTSLLNTPYFINAIQNGVYNNRRKSKYPYIQAAYIFLNSLPIASLREKYKSYNVNSDLDYIASCFNKFGAVHKLPYAWILKMGSVWHRYKKYKESGIDILSSAWSNFDYLTNYSPILSSTTQQYDFNYKQIKNSQIVETPASIVLQSINPNDIKINTGFYPKVINDFNYFYNSFDLYVDYNNTEIQKSIDLGMKVYEFPNSEFNATQNDNNLTLNTWSITIPNFTDTPVTKDCDTKSNAIGTEHFIIPSFGCDINQTKYECIDNPYADTTLSVNLTNNVNMYNGSVRALWSSPNFGYFNSDELVIPPTDAYINQISADKSEQSPFKLLTKDNYSKIEEIFSVFEKRDLDSFENEFLNFSKAITDADSAQPEAQYDTPTVNQNANFRNFQSLFKTMMTVPAPTQTQTDSEFFNLAINNQFTNVQTLLRNFLEYDIILRIGNPSKYKRRIFDSYLSYQTTANVVDPIQFKPYIVGSLPTRTGTVTLQQSKTQNPAAWLTLETEVGFSTIPNVVYSSQGSYITDFFVENNIEFISRNITLLTPLIKMYATAKLESPGVTPAQFKSQLNDYLQQETNIQNNFINQVMDGVRVKLPNQQQLPEKVISSAISGEQSKVENYEVFKALNDKWISGADYKNQTMFEDILFLDRASRNIGETILLDIFDLKSMFGVGGKEGEYSLNQAMSVFTFISGILIKNNFTVMNLPAYVNFYNIQDVDGTSIPQPEGSLEFANSMWGTFLDVDYRKSSSKMVCFYAGKPSSYLDLPKGNSRYRDDSFDLRRASENPLIENQQGKKDWALSNKCVGFNVDLGIRNQNVFYSFSVSQDNGVATSESINTQINMVDQATGRNTATQNVGLYNLYKQRSYKATATCLGNALLQPTMYFNLRHVPMFNGPYMIMDVQHSVQPGNFQTTFTGVRQGIYDLPAIDSFLQSVNKNLLTRLEQLLKIKKDSPIVPATTEQGKSNNVVQKADNTKDTSNSCVSNVDVGLYREYTDTEHKLTTVKAQVFSDALNRIFPGTDENSQVLRASIYTISYVASYQQDANTTGTGEFKGWNNNFGLISLYLNWNPSQQFFTKTYCCVNVKDSSPNGKSQPLVSFANLDEYIKFMGSRLKENTPRILQEGLLKYYVCNWPKNNGVSSSYYDSHINDYTTVQKTINNALSSAQSVGVLPKTSSDELKKVIEEAKKILNSSGSSGTSGSSGSSGTSGSSGSSGTSSLCLPQISSFTPAAGNKGTIIQINGGNLDTLLSVTINGVVILKEKITVINSNTIRFTMPQVGNGITLIKNNFVLTNKDGSVTSSTKFTYNPAINTQTNSGVNTNPQETGVNPLKSFVTPNTNGGTSDLKVEVNLTAGAWEIESQVMTSYTIKKTEIGTNNSIIETIVESKKEIPLTGYVSNDKQKFEITQAQVNSYLTSTVPEINLKNNKVYLQFVVKANALDKVKYPQPAEQSYNFLVVNSITPQTQQQVPSQTPTQNVTPPETQPASFTKVSQSPIYPKDKGGENAYVIQKSDGWYLVFKFNLDPLYTLSRKDEPVVYNIPDYERQNIQVGLDSSTNYMNNITFNGKGTYQIRVSYKVEGKPNETFDTGTEPFIL